MEEEENVSEKLTKPLFELIVWLNLILLVIDFLSSCLLYNFYIQYHK